MANRTAWTGGNLNAPATPLTWTALFSSSDLNSLSNNLGVRSSVADIANTTGLDMFMDVSLRCVVAQTSTLAVGANAALYLFPLLDDGATYGDNSFPTAGAGGFSTNVPGVVPAAIFSWRTATSFTLLAGFAQGVVIPPGSFRGVLVNSSGYTFTGAANAVMFRSYNINLNN